MPFSVLFNNGDDAMLQGDTLPAQPPYKPGTSVLVDRCSMLVIDFSDVTKWYAWNATNAAWESVFI